MKQLQVIWFAGMLLVFVGCQSTQKSKPVFENVEVLQSAQGYLITLKLPEKQNGIFYSYDQAFVDFWGARNMESLKQALDQALQKPNPD